MKRIAIMAAVIIAASAGAYARSVFVQERPSNEPVQVGVVYQASFCGTMMYQSPNNAFYMRVKRELNRGWLEVEWASYPQAFEPTASINSRPLDWMRVNLNSVCYVKPVTP